MEEKRWGWGKTFGNKIMLIHVLNLYTLKLKIAHGSFFLFLHCFKITFYFWFSKFQEGSGCYNVALPYFTGKSYWFRRISAVVQKTCITLLFPMQNIQATLSLNFKYISFYLYVPCFNALLNHSLQHNAALLNCTAMFTLAWVKVLRNHL